MRKWFCKWKFSWNFLDIWLCIFYIKVFRIYVYFYCYKKSLVAKYNDGEIVNEVDWCKVRGRNDNTIKNNSCEGIRWILNTVGPNDIFICTASFQFINIS